MYQNKIENTANNEFKSSSRTTNRTILEPKLALYSCFFQGRSLTKSELNLQCRGAFAKLRCWQVADSKSEMFFLPPTHSVNSECQNYRKVLVTCCWP